MAGVVACFLVTMVLAQAQSRSIDQNARLLTRKALPSLQHLAEANVALRHYAFDALHYALEPPSQRPKVAGELQVSHRELTDALAAYRALDNIPAERAVEAGLDGQIAALDRATANLQRASDDGQALPASELLELRERANAVGFSIARLIGLGSQHGEALAEAITAARRRSLVAELTLGGLSVVLALLATLFTVALTRQFSIFFEARNAELERRADELERFSSRVAHDVLGPLGTVGLALQLAGKRDVLDERARPILTRGLASLGRVQRLVDGLLDFALAGARPAADARASVPEGIAGVVDAVADDA
ncbi:MAG TPA: histidine kinase dimerization/phospho-acceptor domain-containing protein, partial [Myxococcales bacterium]|nr:histidine kinase dimerization/phospho-acceptor domain-containing protein [Myxococcales bacterium]